MLTELFHGFRVSEAKRTSPKSIRAQFGDPNDDSRFECQYIIYLRKTFRNAVHGSDSYEAAGREIEMLFPTITGNVDLTITGAYCLFSCHSTSVFLTFDFFTGDADGINFGNGLQEAVKEVGEEQKTYLARWKPAVF